MTAEEKEKLARKVARAKAALMWGLILDSPNTEDLTKPLEDRTRFRDLADEHKVTLLALVAEFEAGCRDIEADARKKAEQGEAIDVTPVPPTPEASADDANGGEEEASETNPAA